MRNIIWILSLLLFLVGVPDTFSAQDSEDIVDSNLPVDATNQSSDMDLANKDSKVSNKILMYRMLNSLSAKNPETIDYYRRWKKERKLQWLANPKNLKIPGMINEEDPDIY
ncbi:MAG: hypothetical protein ACK5PQ_04050 [Alphaproteobacteria bacterium]